ncbi:LysR family transcriptional regulator [Salinisphaera sp. SWV1]|uniref:LysR family transcriptional regulator n=1 Tax=Salinisphaera sp. SWV1 TaxID=3454139 RepID=UPI003F8504A7
MNLLNAMTTFVRIVDEGSLVAAANSSGLSPAMVGNHLRALEERTGMTLLNRTTRRQSLTEFGRLYYRRCVDILELVEDTDMLAQQSQVTPRGKLRITAPHAFGADWLMPALTDYTAQYPQVTIDLVVDDRLFDLVDDQFEAAIRIGELANEDLVARPLSPFRSLLCAAPGYIAAHGQPAEPAELVDYDCLLYTYARQIHADLSSYVLNLAGPAGAVDVTVTGRVYVNSAAALRRAALSGMGITFLPERAVADDIERGDLVNVLPDYRSPERPLHLLYRRDRRLSPKLRNFIDFVLARFGR